MLRSRREPLDTLDGTIERSALHLVLHGVALVLSCTFTIWIVCLVALAVFAGSGHDPRRYDLVIAADVDARVAAGENPLELPSDWNLVSGDVLVLDNRGPTTQSIGAWSVAAGEVREVVLRPFTGLVQCTLHPDGEITMSVHPARTDWKLALLATMLFGPSLGLGAIVMARILRSVAPDGGPSPHRPVRSDRWLWVTTAALAVGSLACGLVVLRPQAVDAATLAGFVESPSRDVSTMSLPDADGTDVAFVAPPGGVLLVAFGYTSCPDVCPTTMSTLAQAIEGLAPGSADVRVALVSVDPARDDARTLADYVDFFVSDGVGLRTDDAVALDEVAGAFGVTYALGLPDDGGAYEVAHTSVVYGVDDTGHVVVTWPAGLGADAIRHDLQLLVDADVSGGAAS